ncbi:MAG: C25 family peptidase propeptide domain-containing protein, partial [Anaerolineae bacterium]
MKTKLTLRMLIFALLILGSSPTSLVTAQAPPDSHLRLLSSDGQSTLLELVVDGFQTETINYEGQTYHRLIIPGTVQTDTPGEPQVPTRGTLLGLPAAEGVSVQVMDATYETLRGYHLHPAPAVQVTKDKLDDLMAEDVPQTFALDQDLYATDAFYPGKPVEVSHTGTMRDQAIAQVQFYPVQYNPLTGEVRLYRRILARITWTMPLSIAATGTRGASPAYEKLLQSALLNYDALERPPVAEPTPPIGTADTGIGAASITPTLKIGVTEDGVYQLTPTELTGAGFNLSGIDLNTIKISNRGAEIPIYVHDANSNHAFDGSDYILFYGTAITNIYTVKNVYWLTAGGGDGLRMSARDGTPGSAMLAEQFPATLHAEEDTYYWQTMPDGEGQDHWFWGGRLLTGPTASRVYTLTLNHLSTTASTATVRVRLKGGMDNPYLNPDHATQIYLNDLAIGGVQQWDGFSIYDQEATVSHSELDEGNNTVKVELTGTSYQQLYVNWIEIDYWDTYVAENDRLLFGAPAAGTFQFEVTGFSADDVQVFDVTDPSNTAMISNTTLVPAAGGGYKLQFEDSAQPETRYMALTAAQRKSSASIEMDQSSSWKSTSQGADYIIITHKDFYTSALRLANHREVPDMRVATVKVEDIYDEFNYGIFNPRAIRDFLSYAYHNWVSPLPTYVLLIGDATQD